MSARAWSNDTAAARKPSRSVTREFSRKAEASPVGAVLRQPSTDFPRIVESSNLRRQSTRRRGVRIEGCGAGKQFSGAGRFCAEADDECEQGLLRARVGHGKILQAWVRIRVAMVTIEYCTV